MGFFEDSRARREARKAERAARQAEKAAQAEDKKNAQEYAEHLADTFTQERVSIEGNQIFAFPDDLAKGADQGYPFIKFSLDSNDGTEKVSIYLHQPPGISVNDGANYSGFDMGILKQGFRGIKKAFNEGTAGISSADVLATSLIAKDRFVSEGSTIEKITSRTALKTGVATNPYTRTAYESTNIRGYTFNFKMVASNSNESASIVAIERTFRKFLYPKRAGSVAVIYPPLFKIQFYVNKEENQYMPKIKPCYLTALTSTFNATGNTFHQDTGSPVEVDIGLTFQEERALVRQDLYPTDGDITESDQYYTEKSSTGKSEGTSSTGGSGGTA